MSQLEKDVLFVAEWAARADLLFIVVAHDLQNANDQRVWDGYKQRWTATLYKSIDLASQSAGWYREIVRILDEVIENVYSDQDRLEAVEKIRPFLERGDIGYIQASQDFIDLQREILGFKDYGRTRELGEILQSFAVIWAEIHRENARFQDMLKSALEAQTIPRFKVELKLAQPIGASLLSVLVKYLSLLSNRK